MTTEEQAREGFDILVKNLKATCPHLKRDFRVADRDDTSMNFSIDRYAFTLAWEPTTRKGIGRDYDVPEYGLYIWHTVGGSYWNPPEAVDTTLIETQSIHQCITCALETVAKDEIRQCLEGAGYELMLKEENEL